MAFPKSIDAFFEILRQAWMLAIHDKKAELRTSKLALVWPLLYPVCYTVLFVLVKPIFGSGAATNGWEFALFIFTGFSLWQGWFEGFKWQLDAVRKNKGLLSRTDLRIESLFLWGVIVGLFDLFPRLLIILLAASLLDTSSIFAVICFLMISLVLLVNGALIGFVIQPFSTLMQDIGKSIQAISLALIMTGGVFFHFSSAALSSQEWVPYLLCLNPVAPLLNYARTIIGLDQYHFFYAVDVWVIITILLLVLQFYLARKILPILLERTGA